MRTDRLEVVLRQAELPGVLVDRHHDRLPLRCTELANVEGEGERRRALEEDQSVIRGKVLRRQRVVDTVRHARLLRLESRTGTSKHVLLDEKTLALRDRRVPVLLQRVVHVADLLDFIQHSSRLICAQLEPSPSLNAVVRRLIDNVGAAVVAVGLGDVVHDLEGRAP